jgi:hypothetical protein
MNERTNKIIGFGRHKWTNQAVWAKMKTKNLFIFEQIFMVSGSDGHRPILKKRIPKIAGMIAGSKISATYSV